MEKLDLTTWEQTDASTGQFCLRISDSVYKFAQYRGDWSTLEQKPMVATNSDQFDVLTINLDHYTEKQKKEFIKPYGYTIEHLHYYFTEDFVPQIIAECIFEQLI